MRKAFVPIAWMALVVGCSGSVDHPDEGGTAKVSLPGKTFEVSKVTFWYETGEDGYFRVEGDDAAASLTCARTDRRAPVASRRARGYSR